MSEKWQQVKEILIGAMRHTPEERPAFLDRVCSDDKLLRREVESLLSSFDNAESFLETPAAEIAEKVTNFSESGLFLKDPKLSRDGRQLLYSRRRTTGDVWIMRLGQ